jgi:competence protein ComEC
MSDRLLQLRLIVLGSLSVLALLLWLPAAVAVETTATELTVRFLDVGQGDAIHVVTPDGYELLIDGGPSAAVLRELATGRSFFDRTIDVVIATHPDSDHVAGLVDVLERFVIGLLVETAAEHDTTVALAYQQAAQAEGARVVTAQAGQVIQLGASTTVRILSPRGDSSNWRSNVASVVVQLQYGDTEFMLTGDAPSSIEEFLVSQYGQSLESEVLKLGHHGSKTSTSEEFLAVVQPAYGVVSAGSDNRYGHPHQTVITRASEAGAQIVSTAESGTLVFKSDGSKVWRE